MLKADADRNQAQHDHLAQVHALSQALQSAISAIEKNDLPQFQAHLAVQETICNRLACNQETRTLSAESKKSSGESHTQMEREIRQAYSALAQLNRVYAAILKRASKSVELMSAVYRSHETGYDPGPSGLTQSHTWSCEV